MVTARLRRQGKSQKSQPCALKWMPPETVRLCTWDAHPRPSVGVKLTMLVWFCYLAHEPRIACYADGPKMVDLEEVGEVLEADAVDDVLRQCEDISARLRKAMGTDGARSVHPPVF